MNEGGTEKKRGWEVLCEEKRGREVPCEEKRGWEVPCEEKRGREVPCEETRGREVPCEEKRGCNSNDLFTKWWKQLTAVTETTAIVICRAKRGKRDLRDLRTWTQVWSIRKKIGGSPVSCSRNTTAGKDGEQMRIEDSGGNHVTPDGPGQVPEGVRGDPEEAGGSEQTLLEPNANVTDFVEVVHIPEGTRVTGSGPEGGHGNRD
ncbi:hypothetical protein DFH07DRAFT_772315 [Mycena maculata]|uniref:Uncharacterized protein n=1 Tax=Mycena maculata TaxID=230809 RepID=A0AAD7J9D8_9AGAR|nr:hypothetical protein DFH07DRAFT_772315 [Mycena maculata]